MDSSQSFSNNNLWSAANRMGNFDSVFSGFLKRQGKWKQQDEPTHSRQTSSSSSSSSKRTGKSGEFLQTHSSYKTASGLSAAPSPYPESVPRVAQCVRRIFPEKKNQKIGYWKVLWDFFFLNFPKPKANKQKRVRVSSAFSMKSQSSVGERR